MTPDATAEPTVALLELTKDEMLELVAALQALVAVEDRARSGAYGYGAEQKMIRAGAIVAERSDVAQGAISSLLIALDVHGGSRRAHKALARL